MAFPTISTVIDDYNRADNASLGSNWTEAVITTHTGQGIRDNAAEPDTSSSNSTAWWNVETFGPDCEAYVKQTRGSLLFCGVYARLTNPGTASCDGYHVLGNFGDDTVKIYRIDNEVRTQINSTSVLTLAIGDSIGIACVGDQIASWYKSGAGAWQNIATVTDATYASAGYMGTYLQGTAGAGGALLDNFSGGTIQASDGTAIAGLGRRLMGWG